MKLLAGTLIHQLVGAVKLMIAAWSVVCKKTGFRKNKSVQHSSLHEVSVVWQQCVGPSRLLSVVVASGYSELTLSKWMQHFFTKNTPYHQRSAYKLLQPISNLGRATFRFRTNFCWKWYATEKTEVWGETWILHWLIYLEICILKKKMQLKTRSWRWRLSYPNCIHHLMKMIRL